MQEMKALSLLSFGMALALSAQAALVRFQLSPPGTDVGVGLSPSNTVPQVVGSTGSGNAISGGSVFDTDSRMLSVAVGYGSAAGFTDLTAVPTTMHIHAGGPGTKVEPDWIITGDHTVKLRAEGAGEGHRRVYTITLQAQDASGNSATKNVYVPVGKGREDGEHGDGDHGDCRGD
jgi:hypothetical protein